MRIGLPVSLVVVLAVVAMAVAGALLAADFEGGQTVTLDGFETRGMGREGKTEWELHGRKARMRGGLYHLSSIRLVVHLDEKQKATVTSERCVFDQTRGIAHSDAPLHVVSDGMTLDGVGYDIATERKVLRIRSKVRMKVRKVGAGMSPEEIFRPLGSTPKPSKGKTAPRSEKETR